MFLRPSARDTERRRQLRNAWNVPAAVVVGLLGRLMCPLFVSQKPSEDVAAALSRFVNAGDTADFGHDTCFGKKHLAHHYILGDSLGEWESKAEALRDDEDPKNKVNSSML